MEKVFADPLKPDEMSSSLANSPFVGLLPTYDAMLLSISR